MAREDTVRDLVYRGCSYDVGSNFQTGQGAVSRLVWSVERMREEIDAIKDGLHANSVTIYGSLVDRLEATVDHAVSRGLHVWLQPRVVDTPQDETIDHLVTCARIAERHRRAGADIRFSIGSVHLLFTPGFVPGEKYHDRMATYFGGADHDHHFFSDTGESIDWATATTRLNTFLARAAGAVRAVFGGELTYSAAPFEDVDWGLVDYIGLTHYYSYHPTPEGYAEELDAYRRWGKPLVIAEFGTPTYRGAAERGLLAFDVVDRSAEPPTILDGYVRDEDAQAEFHVRMLRMFAEFGVHSAAMTELIHPTHPHSADPRLDLDVASMAITKTIREDHAAWDSPYRFEPKESFRAIGRYYAEAQARDDAARAAA